MNITFHIPIGLVISVIGLLAVGCASDPNNVTATNRKHPGPVVGTAVGVGVGSVGGSVVGGVVGFGEGFAAAVKAPFNNTSRVVRRWRTETTSDGRTIQVPEDIIVDSNGRPMDEPAKK